MSAELHTDRDETPSESPLRVALSALAGTALLIAGVVIGSQADVLDDAQYLAVALVVLGFLTWLLIPIVREVVVASVLHPTRDSKLSSPSVTTVFRQRSKLR
jgi:hypothetical protein